MKAVLEALESYLMNEHDFGSNDIEGSQHMLGNAGHIARSAMCEVFPVTIFREWLARCPEAREFLAGMGFRWEDETLPTRYLSDPDSEAALNVIDGYKTPLRAPQTQQSVSSSTKTKGNLLINVRISDEYRSSEVLDVVGHLIRVRPLGYPHGAIYPVTIESVSPVDRDTLLAYLKEHPGMITVSDWEGEEESSSDVNELLNEMRLLADKIKEQHSDADHKKALSSPPPPPSA